MHDEILSQIKEAQREIDAMVGPDTWNLKSIQRQLCWCRDMLEGREAEPPPGPLTMGLLATRELDMYGNLPELASCINAIEDTMNREFAEILEEARRASLRARKGQKEKTDTPSSAKKPLRRKK